MAKLTMERFLELQSMGREPISLPDEIYFSGNEKLQKTPGRHHLPEFRKTGTYYHPNLIAQRKRVAIDRVNRLIKNKMSDVEMADMGGIAGLKASLSEHGLSFDETEMELIESSALELEQVAKLKKSERETKKQEFAETLGGTYGKVDAEPVNPKDDIVRAKIEALSQKVAPSEDLSSGDEGEKEKSVAAKPAVKFKEM